MAVVSNPVTITIAGRRTDYTDIVKSLEKVIDVMDKVTDKVEEIKCELEKRIKEDQHGR